MMFPVRTICTVEKTDIQKSVWSNTRYFDVTLPNPRLQFLVLKRKTSTWHSNIELTVAKNPSLEEWENIHSAIREC